MANKPISNKNLLREIWNSKLSYCEIFDPRFTIPDVFTDDLDGFDVREAMAALAHKTGEPVTGITIGHITEEHIPRAAVAGKSKKLGHLDGVCFKPFIVYRAELIEGDLVLEETVRSFSRDGWFCPNQGRITPALAADLVLMVERYAIRGSYRNYSYIDEMRALAVENLIANMLKFEEDKGNNPFAYATTCIQNMFNKYLNTEKKQQSIRDDLLEIAGVAPSMSRQLSEMDTHREPSPVRHVLVGDPEKVAAIFANRGKKRGRPSK